MRVAIGADCSGSRMAFSLKKRRVYGASGQKYRTPYFRRPVSVVSVFPVDAFVTVKAGRVETKASLLHFFADSIRNVFADVRHLVSPVLACYRLNSFFYRFYGLHEIAKCHCFSSRGSCDAFTAAGFLSPERLHDLSCVFVPVRVAAVSKCYGNGIKLFVVSTHAGICWSAAHLASAA